MTALTPDVSDVRTKTKIKLTGTEIEVLLCLLHRLDNLLAWPGRPNAPAMAPELQSIRHKVDAAREKLAAEIGAT